MHSTLGISWAYAYLADRLINASPNIVRFVDGRVGLHDIDWTDVVGELNARGWARLKAAVASGALEALEAAAPGPWVPSPETEGGGGVRQAGLGCHCAVDDAADVVRSLAEAIRSGIDSANFPSVAPLPEFNHANWNMADQGRKFITPHADPVTAGGVIAVLTLRGRAVFRIWDAHGSLVDADGRPGPASSWETEDGDLVVMRGGGWPEPTSMCPMHEAESPVAGDRVTLTLRHNKGGYGADYFSPELVRRSLPSSPT